VIFPQPTFKKEKNETHFARAMKSNEEASFVPAPREGETLYSLSLFLSFRSLQSLTREPFLLSTRAQHFDQNFVVRVF
jgi:hypothetical protein